MAETHGLTTTTALPKTPLEVVWKGTSTTPDEEFEELAQFAKVYVFSSMKKATKAREFMKQKDERTHQMEKHSSQAEAQMQAQVSFVKRQYVSEIKQKDGIVNELQEKLRQVDANVLNLAKFKNEAYDLNQQPQHEQQLLCNQLDKIQAQEKLVNSFLDDLIDMENQYDETNCKLNEILTWKEDMKRFFPNLPRINKM